MKKTFKTLILGLALFMVCLLPAACSSSQQTEQPVTSIAKYTVSFESNSGSSVESQKVTYGTKISVPTTSRNGYQFQGWYTDTNFQYPYNFDISITNHLTLYAKWGKIHDVTFKNGTTIWDYQNVIDGKRVAAPKAIDTNKSGYEFHGWYKDVNFQVPYDFDTPVTNTLTLYGKWDAVYTVKFYTNGGYSKVYCNVLGIIKDDSTQEYTINEGNTISKLAVFRDEYKFLGWYEDGVNEPFDFDVPISRNVDLYAKWTLNPNFEYQTSFSNANEEIIYKYVGNLTALTIPQTDGSKPITGINSGAFVNFPRLVSVVIPNTVTTIDAGAFSGDGFYTIYCEATSKPDGWADDWMNGANLTVLWGNQWELVDGVPSAKN